MKLITLLLLVATYAFGVEELKPVMLCLRESKFAGEVNGRLAQGWTVQHQSVAYDHQHADIVILVTLLPPTPEQQKLLEQKRQVAEEAKRAELKRWREEYIRLHPSEAPAPKEEK